VLRGLVLILAGVAATAAAPAAAQVDLARVGPAVGAIAPAFTLPDHEGRERSLATLLGPQGALLVFSRSADW
jgi:cytochrome oxidase Cu insertion factor (SCO1/SenC/PrrC family)